MKVTLYVERQEFVVDTEKLSQNLLHRALIAGLEELIAAKARYIRRTSLQTAFYTIINEE